jgi:integrase
LDSNSNRKYTSTIFANTATLPDENKQRMIENITIGLRPAFSKLLNSLSWEGNGSTIVDYIQAMKIEINLSDNYRSTIIVILCRFSTFVTSKEDNKTFKTMTRDDILSFLDSFRRSEVSDPMHKWIGTYNLYRMTLFRFFKWLYYPDIELDKRPNPLFIENIPQLKRKEKSIYKPTDLWTPEDDLIFLKYCPSKRNKCFHAVAYDTGCRPHELLKLRIKDIVFKKSGTRQYAEVLVNGKTGSRHIPLINSIPYVKDYLDHEHPQPSNPNTIFLSGIGKSLGRPIGITSLNTIYNNYKKDFFPKLLNSPNVPPEDKLKIRELLKKPWNPYVRRHSALTDKSKILKEHTLRQFAGWSMNSNMPQKYIHYFGNEASESLLEAYGITTKDQKLSDALKSKQCPNCSEPNKPDSKFCAHCRMVLTYDEYNETIDEKDKKDKQIELLIKKQENFELLIQSLIDSGQLKASVR